MNKCVCIITFCVIFHPFLALLDLSGLSALHNVRSDITLSALCTVWSDIVLCLYNSQPSAMPHIPIAHFTPNSPSY